MPVLVEPVALLVAIESDNRDFIFFLELEVITVGTQISSKKGLRSREMAGPVF
jgi:hypothetical protein